jgi:hypothetical protein
LNDAPAASAPDVPPPVVLRDVDKIYGERDEAVHALSGVSLRIERGEMVESPPCSTSSVVSICPLRVSSWSMDIRPPD